MTFDMPRRNPARMAKPTKHTGFTAIILAAGKGVRMKSALPKVLHPVAGLPMLARVVFQAQKAGAKEVRIVVGFGENLVRQVVEPMGAVCFRQVEQKGTADAVRSAQPEGLEGPVLILNGDHPLIEAADIEKALKAFGESESLMLVTAKVKKPGSYGRIVRHHGEVKAIVEAKDASAETLKINEINTGIYVVDGEHLNSILPKIQSNNAQGEFYLTDLVGLTFESDKKVKSIELDRRVAVGVNSQLELSRATRIAFKRKALQLMEDGVMIMDPLTTYVESEVEVGASSVLYPGVYLKGTTKLGEFCVVEPNAFLHNAKLAESVQIRAGSYLEDCVIGAKSVIGPYARIRPSSVLGSDVRIGNFVELKNANMARGSKANHLAYLGDVEVGEDTNIGCGTITCNYATDRKKYKTIIGKDVFVGSDTQFVAPITIGDGAVIGSGSTITKDVPANALAVARGRQIIKENYTLKK